MERVVPWRELCALIEQFYPEAGNGPTPAGLVRMLRIYFLQQWFDLSDPAAEEAMYDSASMRQLADIDLGREPAPDETSICKFRHLLERHELGRRIFEAMHDHFEACAVQIATGTIVDVTIVGAPSSTKNKAGARDPGMHQTRQGRQRYFGMRAHFGVDNASKVINTVVATAANVHDATVLPDLLHGDETCVWGDQAYRGQRSAIREHASHGQDFTNRRYRNRAMVDEAEKARNRIKSGVRANFEHSIGVIKQVFGL